MGNLSFKHSGRLGDIVYSLPLIKVMAERNNSKADLYILNDDYYDSARSSMKHPGEGVTVSKGLFEFIKPLLENIPYLDKVVHCAKSELPANCIDLDSFKNQNLNLMASGNQIWYRKVFSTPIPFEERWINFKKVTESSIETKFNIIVSKTNRYYNKAINYNFLNEVEKVGFMGLKYEYDDFVQRNNIKQVEYIPTNNAYEFALNLLSTKLFIGNQSLGFSIAEGLKIPRAVEVYEPLPVVIPIGGKCIEFIRTDQIINFINNEFNISIKDNYPDNNMGFVECVLTEKPQKLSKKIKNYWRAVRGKPVKN